jgi:HTH-type transcriptional regulator / antitoxin MqsA
MKCELCRGELKNKLITYTTEHGGSLIVVENVPASVCINCGGEILTPPVLDNIKKITSEKKPKKHIEVPLYDLSELEIIDNTYNSPEYHTPSRCVFNLRTDLKNLMKKVEGESEHHVWITGGNNMKHPDEEILKQLIGAFSPVSGEKVQKIVKGTVEGGYIVSEIKKELDDQGKPLADPIAKMIYSAGKNIWHLYWVWRSGIWQDYGSYPDLNHVVEQIKEDKLRFCA